MSSVLKTSRVGLHPLISVDGMCTKKKIGFTPFDFCGYQVLSKHRELVYTLWLLWMSSVLKTSKIGLHPWIILDAKTTLKQQMYQIYFQILRQRLLLNVEAWKLFVCSSVNKQLIGKFEGTEGAFSSNPPIHSH